MSRSTSLPDNLKSRVSRVYVIDDEFKTESGQMRKYSQLIIEFIVKDLPVTYKCSIKPNDKALLSLAEQMDRSDLT